MRHDLMCPCFQIDVLFGDVNPSGKLPYTVGKTLEDYGKGGQVLYTPNGVIPQQNFDEGIYIDYRHFDKVSVRQIPLPSLSDTKNSKPSFLVMSSVSVFRIPPLSYPI